jgi:hypothetical protein
MRASFAVGSLAWAAAALTLGACSMLVDTGGLDSTAKSTPEGGTDPEAGVGPDGEGAIPSDGPSNAEGGSGCDGYLYCNSFDTTADLILWKAMNIGGAIDTVVKHGGLGSLHLRLGNDQASNGIYAYEGSVVIPQHAFMRTMLKLVNPGGIMYFGRADYVDGVSTYVASDGAFHLSHYGGSDIGSGLVPDRTSWHCVELEVDAINHIANAWFDDSRAFGLALANFQGPYELFTYFLNPSSKEAWLDELVISTSRIGCPNPP